MLSFLQRLPWTERPRKEKVLVDEDGEIVSALAPDGSEVPDPTPMAPPVGYKPAPSLADQIREMVRSERLAREAQEAGFETFEEADDFDVGDDYEPNTPYEETFDPQGRSSFTPVDEVTRQEQAANEAAKAKAPSSPPEPSVPAQPAPPANPPKADPPQDPA